MKADIHVERARQIADALDAQDMEQTLYEQFYAEWKAWEAEGPKSSVRTMREFDRAIGRGEGYTGRIVRGVTSETRAPRWGSGTNKRTEVVAKVLRDQPEIVAKAMEDPKVAAKVMGAASAKAARNITRASIDHGNTEAIEKLMRKAPARTREDVDAAQAERLPEPPPPDPWEEFWPAVRAGEECARRLDEVHERMHADAWNQPPSTIRSIAENSARLAELLRSKAIFLEGLADAASTTTNT